MQPLRYDGAIPVFDTMQLEIYGLPDHYGYTQYEVIVNKDQESPYYYSTHQAHKEGSIKHKHIYIRYLRFVSIFRQLIGGSRQKIPKKVYALFDPEDYQKLDTKVLWDTIRNTLKRSNYQRYYNRIPDIIQFLKLGSIPKIEDDIYQAILADYKAVEIRFHRVGAEAYNRKYFPNLRWLSFKLMQLHGIHFPYHIPHLRTKRNLKSLEYIWNTLV